MKANELMIGDWVNLSKGNWSENRQVELTDIEMIAESVYLAEPIPVTPEILEKNFRGYKRGSGALTYFIYELNEEYFICASTGSIDLCLHYDDSEHAAHDDIYLVELMYVHTLQHALRLFGFDKEIVL